MRRRAIAPIVHKLERTLKTIGECSPIQEFFGEEHFGRTRKNDLHESGHSNGYQEMSRGGRIALWPNWISTSTS